MPIRVHIDEASSLKAHQLVRHGAQILNSPGSSLRVSAGRLDHIPGSFDSGSIPNGDFETDVTGWTAGGTNTIVQSTNEAKFGAASAQLTYQDTLALAATSLITLTAESYDGRLWVWIPANWDGGDITVDFLGFTGMTGGGPNALVDVDMSFRDDWQAIATRGTPDAGDLSGQLRIRTMSAPTAGRFIYVDGVSVRLS